MIRASIIAGGLVGLVGCGGAERARLQASLDDARNELRIIHTSFEAQRRKLQTIDDRLALVEDRAEAQRIHGAVPQLPVVRLSPPTPQINVSEQRGVTHITQGDLSPRRRRLPRRPVQPPANAANAGNIGVQPLGALTDAKKPPAPAAAPAPPEDPAVSAYRDAKTLFERGDLVAAIPALNTFAQQYPNHAFADNALFMMARGYYDRAQYGAAVRAFRHVVEAYPTGNKVPDALLMIGRTQMKLGRPAEGRETLARLIAMFPKGDAARRAQAELGSGSRM
jgi:tol-pal system protein YbgF